MWFLFKNNIMKLVPFLLVIQIGYTLAKAVEISRSCNDSTENDPRLKRSDEKENYSGTADVPVKDLEDPATRKLFSKPNTSNEFGNANDFATLSNTLPQKLPLVNDLNVPVYVEQADIGIIKITTTEAPLEQPIYYKTIDPKYLIVSGLVSKPNKNMTNVGKTEKTITVINETKLVDNTNYTEVTKDLNKDKANDTKEKEMDINDFVADVTNIRELREHLLDHLLDYFLNIIKEENFIRNDTINRNDNDRMKVEDKLRNYYDPHHLDMLFVDDDDDDDYEDSNLDFTYDTEKNDSQEDLLDNVKQHKDTAKENENNITLNSQVDDKDKNKNTRKANNEENQNISSPFGELFYFNVSEPTTVTSIHVDTDEKENESSKVNTTKNSFDHNDNVTITTEKSTSSETFNDEDEVNEPLNHSDEVGTDRVDFSYDSDAYTVSDYSYEDFNGSEEVEVVKKITENPIDIITEDGRRKNEGEKETHIANSTLNDTENSNKNSLNLRNDTTDSTHKEKEVTATKGFGILDLPKANNISIYNVDNLADIGNKNSTKKTKLNDKRKLKINKGCGIILSKLINKKKKKEDCRNNIILNLKINLF